MISDSLKILIKILLNIDEIYIFTSSLSVNLSLILMQISVKKVRIIA